MLFIGKDRSYGWQLSLQGKDGNYTNDATKEVAERISKNKEEKSRLSETNFEPDFGKVHPKGTSHAPLPNPMLPLGKELSCSLAAGSKSNIVVKVGKILEGKEQALLPVPVGDKLKFVEDALGSHVARPRELVVKANQAIRQPTARHFKPL
ncbi:hypothetical protein IFM89_006641 [Coptis chinensis]|uniref:Uncharacterized protein n=1 Tax=Coptis chinensis TaxID=261450 RepID=A0A835HNW0_9MAGN|nr:hypothetical protein IFM89_006641 [Coptis chinensis]